VCVYYYRPDNSIYLFNDAGNAVTSALLGSATILENSQCNIYCADTTVSGSGNNLTLSFRIELKTATMGGKTLNAYLYTKDSVASDGYKLKGTISTP